MIKIISDPKQILKLQQQFRQKLIKSCNEVVKCWLGHPGGNFEWEVFHSQEEHFWVAFIDHDNRSWNGFGIGKPREGKNNSIIGEINFPIDGINRRIAGAFAIDETGNILVLHRGKIGGGSPGVGKNLFVDNFKGDIIKAIDGDRESDFCFVAELQSPLFHLQIATFIREIEQIKRLRKYGSDFSFDNLLDYAYTNEKYGTSITERHDSKVIRRIHGIVANSLEKEITKLGFGTGSDRNRDIFAHRNGKIISLFEIKTNISTQCLYTAVGQLLIYSIPIKGSPNLIAVLPKKLRTEVEKQLKQIGIKILYYDFNEGNPIFKDLHEYL